MIGYNYYATANLCIFLMSPLNSCSILTLFCIKIRCDAVIILYFISVIVLQDNGHCPLCLCEFLRQLCFLLIFLI